MKKLLLLTLLPISILASPIKGIDESYQDWNLVCDNTGTCSMWGEPREENMNISISFTRPAGENTAISGELSFYSYEDKEIIGKFTEILLDKQSLGRIQNDFERGNTQTHSLTEAQTVALLNALKRNTDIQIVSGQFKGQLSDKGAAATMLRMDEFQKRLNTPSALIRKGNSAKAVLAAQNESITAVAIPNRQKYILKKGTTRFGEVMALLRQANGTDENAESYCPYLHQDDDLRDNITIYPLTNRKVLVESICGMYDLYYVVMDEALTKVEQKLANKYNYASYDEDKHFLTVSRDLMPNRCFDYHEAVWNGKIFIRTEEGNQCRYFPIFKSQIVVK